MSNHESEEPDPDSFYGKEIPSHEDVAEEIAYAPPVGEPNQEPEEASKPQAHQEEAIPGAKKLTNLQIALKGRNIKDILPRLSQEEALLLSIRYDLTTGRRLISQRKAADQLGLSRDEFRNRETELMSQISDLADWDLPDTETQ